MKVYTTERDGVYTARIPIPLSNGQEIIVEGTASVGEVMEDFGYPDDPYVGDIFSDVGNFFKKVAKSKAVRKCVSIAKDVIKSPVTNAALGIVTGGASVPAMTAASAGIRMAEAAAKGGLIGKRVRKVMKATMRLAEKKKRKRRRRKQRRKQERLRFARTAAARLRGERPPRRDREWRRKVALMAAAARGRPVRRPPVTRGEAAARFLVNVHFK